MQRKISLLNGVGVMGELFPSLPLSLGHQGEVNSGLILVMSLVQKIPNLGGTEWVWSCGFVLFLCLIDALRKSCGRDWDSGIVGCAYLIRVLQQLYLTTTGLCRTCEVFGVSELIVDNLSILQDREFQSLSVTAEKWLVISEVCVCVYLCVYLCGVCVCVLVCDVRVCVCMCVCESYMIGACDVCVNGCDSW